MTYSWPQFQCHRQNFNHSQALLSLAWEVKPNAVHSHLGEDSQVPFYFILFNLHYNTKENMGKVVHLGHIQN